MIYVADYNEDNIHGGCYMRNPGVREGGIDCFLQQVWNNPICRLAIEILYQLNEHEPESVCGASKPWYNTPHQSGLKLII